MSHDKIVRINNRSYDAVTGMPIEESTQADAASSKKEKATPRQQNAASAIHGAPQRTQTLHRRATKKPGASVKQHRPKPGTHMDIARSGAVAKFAAHPVAAPVAQEKKPVVQPDAPAKAHPIAKKATAKVTSKKSASLSAKQVKDVAIAKALEPSKTSPSTEKPVKAKKPRRLSWTRRRAIVAAIMLFVLSAAAVTYFNLPGLSVALASSQSGVNASYPKYVPDGYSLRQPVTFKDGEVALRFGSNASGNEYTITQTSKTWDSSAVRDNVVRPAVGENYIINQERGLTIYTYNTSAAWVNAGILYVIDGNAPLSGDQLRRIATSL
jgi:hypothetical protein